ncbi:MAG TPA: hypothetical protein PLH39_04315, partial [Promineifilum sp.]|nr:hypothetical protein [Promineifilum sp.]
PRAVWFLTGAWFLGTIANAVMTWWAVSLTLLGHDFGNEVLSRATLLRYVPIFVAMLVWLTRILFIGAFSVAGEDVFDQARAGESKAARRSSPQPVAQPARAARPEPQIATPPAPKPRMVTPARPTPAAAPTVTYEPVDDPIVGPPPTPKTNPNGALRPTSHIQKRPPMPGNGIQRAPGNMRAQGKNGN